MKMSSSSKSFYVASSSRELSNISSSVGVSGGNRVLQLQQSAFPFQSVDEEKTLEEVRIGEAAQC